MSRVSRAESREPSLGSLECRPDGDGAGCEVTLALSSWPGWAPSAGKPAGGKWSGAAGGAAGVSLSRSSRSVHSESPCVESESLRFELSSL